MSRPKIYKLPDNLTYDNCAKQYRYRNSITKQFTYFGNNKSEATERAKKANRYIETQLRKRRIYSNQHKFKNLVEYYKDEVLPTKPWAQGTSKIFEIRLNAASKSLGERSIINVDRIVIADWINDRCTTADCRNKWRAMFIELYECAISRKLADFNEAKATLKMSGSKKLKVNHKQRDQLNIKDFWAIHKQASLFLQNAMELSLITLQSRHELCNVKFSDRRDGWLYFIRQKTSSQTDMAFIRIEVTPPIETIINRAR